MKKNVLAIVFTPLQFISAQSFISNNNCDPSSKILIFASDKKNVKSIVGILEGNYLFPFKNLAALPVRVNWLFKAIYIRFFLNPQKFDLVVLGNYNNIFAYFLGYNFSRKHKEVYLVDDGFSTINVFEKRNDNKTLGFSFRKGLLDRIIYNLLNINNSNIISNLNFYTFFALPNGGIDNVIPAIENPFRKQNITIDKKEICFFIGAPVVELGFLSFEKFYSIINEIQKEYNDKGIEMIYVLHRLEKIKNIDIAQQRFNKPIELIFGSEISFFPSHIISFFSTALFTLFQLYPNMNYCYYDISENIEDLNKRENVSSIYNYLSSLKSIKRFPEI